MNLNTLKAAEQTFLNKYPGGFNHPEMVAIGKKHKMEPLVAFAEDSFTKTAFKDTQTLIEAIVKLTTRSSMVSVFEKMKFRDSIYRLSDMDKQLLADGLYQRLHGNAQQGFDKMLSVLKPEKLAKWSLITVCPAYFRPTEEVFVKPTTAKGVVNYFELEPLKYHPTPTWAFYEGYKNAINTMKLKVDSNLSPSNPAFSGFLMMSLPG